MGRFASLVDSPSKIELFKENITYPRKWAYDIVPQNKSLQIGKWGKLSFL